MRRSRLGDQGHNSVSLKKGFGFPDTQKKTASHPYLIGFLTSVGLLLEKLVIYAYS